MFYVYHYANWGGGFNSQYITIKTIMRKCSILHYSTSGASLLSESQHTYSIWFIFWTLVFVCELYDGFSLSGYALTVLSTPCLLSVSPLEEIPAIHASLAIQLFFCHLSLVSAVRSHPVAGYEHKQIIKVTPMIKSQLLSFWTLWKTATASLSAHCFYSYYIEINIKFKWYCCQPHRDDYYPVQWLLWGSNPPQRLYIAWINSPYYHDEGRWSAVVITDIQLSTHNLYGAIDDTIKFNKI